MDIKQTLISIRKDRGYSKKTVSEMTGIPYTTYIKYESGERKDISMDSIIKLADFYHITTDYLLGRKSISSEPIDDLAYQFNMTTLEKKILDNYLSLPKHMRTDLMEFLYKTVKEVQEESNND